LAQQLSETTLKPPPAKKLVDTVQEVINTLADQKKLKKGPKGTQRPTNAISPHTTMAEYEAKAQQNNKNEDAGANIYMRVAMDLEHRVKKLEEVLMCDPF